MCTTVTQNWQKNTGQNLMFKEKRPFLKYLPPNKIQNFSRSLRINNLKEENKIFQVNFFSGAGTVKTFPAPSITVKDEAAS